MGTVGGVGCVKWCIAAVYCSSVYCTVPLKNVNSIIKPSRENTLNNKIKSYEINKKVCLFARSDQLKGTVSRDRLKKF